MPGNEVPENIHNFFEQNSSSQAHQSQVGDGNWPVLNNNPWIGTQMNGIPPTFNSKNYAAHTLDSERGNGIQSIQTPFGTNLTRSTLKPELIRSQPRNQQINLDRYMHGSQGLQARPIQADFQRDGTMSDTHRSLMHRGFSSFEQNNAPAYSFGLARSSERPEATEAAASYNFIGGQQLMRNQHPGHAQLHPGQKQEINEMQLLQQQLMFKRLQEMHRQQHLQHLQQRGKNHDSQISGFARQGTNGQLPDLLSGVPINDASNYMRSDEPVGGELKLPRTSHMLHSGNMNLAQHSRFSVQGIPNGLIFPQDRGQVIRSMGFVSQQPDQSLYGTPVASTRGSLAHLSHFQGTVHDFMSTDSVGVNLAEKASMHSSAFQYIQGDQYAVTAQGYLQDENSLTKQRIQGKSMFEDAPVQSESGGATSGSFQQGNHFSPIVQVKEVGPSQDVTSLDPTNEKLFFSANNDGNQDNPFEGSADTDRLGGYLHGNPSQGNDYLSAFPSIQSGSWSALMQEALEASSSDTGLNEEWSGLSFQKMELSSGNHYAAVDANSGKQHAPWDDGNSQNASSLTSRPFPLFNDTEGSPKCHATPTLQTFNFSYQQDDGAAADAFHESFQQCPKEHNAESCDQQKQLVEGSLQMQSQLNNTSNGVWGGHMQEEQASSAHSSEYPQNMQHPLVQQQKVPLLSANNHPLNKSSGWNVEALAFSGGHASESNENDYQKQHSMNMEREHEGSMRKFGGSQVAAPYPNSAGGQERVESDTNRNTMRSEGPYAGNLAAIMDANNLKPNLETDPWLLRRQQANYGKHVTNTFLKNKVEKYHNQPTNSSQAWCSSIGNTDRTSSETLIRQQENSHKQELTNLGFNPSYLMSQQNAERNGPHQPVSSSLMSGQDGRENFGLCRFPFHPTGNLEMSMEPMDSQNHTSYSRSSSQSGVLGLKNQEQGYAGGTQFAGHAANSVVDMEQGHLTELKRNARAAEEIKSRSSFGNQSSMPSSDGAASPFEQNKRSGVTSENMLELFHKVDQSTVGNTTACFDFSPSEVLDGDISDGSVSHFQHNQFSLQGIVLKLAPPSQQQSVDTFPSQPSLKQTASDIDQRNPESVVREEVQTWSLSPSSVQHLPPDHKASVGEKIGDKPFVHGKRSKEPMNSNSQGNSLTVAAHTLRMNQFLMHQQQIQQQQQQIQQQQQQQQQKISSATGPAPNNQPKNLPSANKIDEGDKPFVLGNRSKEPIDSNSQGNSLTVAARTLGMNQFLMHQKQQQQQHQHQQPPPPPPAPPPPQQKISSATGPTPNNQSKNLPSANIIDLVQPFHTGKGHWSDMGFTDQSADEPPTRFTPSANNCVSVPSQYPVSAGHSQPVNSGTHLRSSGQQEASVGTRSAGRPSCTSAMSHQGGFSEMLNNMWTSVSSQRQASEMQPQKIISNVLQSMSSLPSSRETNSLALQKVKSQKRKGESDPSEQGEEDTSSQEMPPPERVGMAPKAGSASQGQEPDRKHSHDSSFDRHKGYDAHPGVSSSNRNTGPDGHSLRSSDLQKQNYSLLQQMQMKRAADSDPSRRDAKRLKNEDFVSESSQKDQRYVYGQNTILREMDVRSQNVSLPSDMQMSFSSGGNEGKGAKTSVQDTSKEAPSHDQVRRYQDIHNHTLPQGKSPALAFAGGSERPQMAQSWFEQYGNFKNGQIATAVNAVESLQRSANAAGQRYLFSKFSESMNQAIVPEQQYEASQVGSLRDDTSPTPVDANQYLASPHPPPLELTSNNTILIPKKRKSATEDLLPWHKEVTEGCQTLQSLSSTEWEWARATNRVDKVEDEFEMIEDGFPVMRSRRRLILTTQLMQQILPSVPAAFLTADVTLSCESVAYFCAKLTLRDACSVISWSGVDSRMDVDSSNKGCRKLNTKEKKGGNHFLKAVEDFIGRSRRLENDFLSLDRRASILDLRLECQELERSSIMNRFAKFHDRAQIKGGESSSTFGTARLTYPRRHATALALRTDFPEGVIFLSL